MTSRCIIIANGDMNDYHWHKSLLQENDFIICADGGTRHALAMGIIPQVVLGDFDSLSPEAKCALSDTGCHFEEHPEEKDMTDTELALKCCLARNPDEILLLGVLGTRYDHSMANLFLLARIPGHIQAKAVNEQNEIMLLREEVKFSGSPGDLVSLIPLSAEVKGIFTKGLKYMLRNATLDQGSSRGVSNEMVEAEASIRIKDGMALVIRAWDQPRN
ncbi:thiamine diphosphokinase [Candidatus Formimonas warabiya]|uniref:Thiamine diphosphokinase n=1 Tax=Formimonas warabiya TaxID=1761012 RepID=A0A3G1KRE7_FORW1|nr:thiamine diphosphokinase [Candidatus Formimonas warabiya]ATW24685.1 thiamine diphosphokinase [Candidatus Formimonas warabiya]